jgi:hypothetical protein
VACTSGLNKLGGALGPVGAVKGFLQDRNRLGGNPCEMVQGSRGAERHPSRRAAQGARHGLDNARPNGGRRRAVRAITQVRDEVGQQRQAEGHQHVVVGALHASVLIQEQPARLWPRAGAERLAGGVRVRRAQRGKRSHHVGCAGVALRLREGGAQQLDQPRRRAGSAGRSREAFDVPQSLGAAECKCPAHRHAEHPRRVKRRVAVGCHKPGRRAQQPDHVRQRAVRDKALRARRRFHKLSEKH